MNRVAQAAAEFIDRDDTIAAIKEYGHGIIHDTFLVIPAAAQKKFILQRINITIFENPAAVMDNLLLVSEHIRRRMQIGNYCFAVDWQMMHAIAARDGRYLFRDAIGDFWRALSYIQGATPLERITGLNDAREAGRALGTFHRLSDDLDPGLLQVILPGFHNIEHYLENYDEAVKRTNKSGKLDRYCRQFVEDRRVWAPVLEEGRRSKQLRVRVVHGDPKTNNIMVDSETGRGVSIIDLDTVMPGLVHYDIGDCLRSCCNRAGEDIMADTGAVRFDLSLCDAFLSGYMDKAGELLTGTDIHFLFDAIRLLPYELGLRFYTDYLEGNRYFKTSNPGQNLKRALVQFRLAESIEMQENEIRTLIPGCRTTGKINPF